MLAPDKDTAVAGLYGLIQQNARAMLWAHLVSTTVLPPLGKVPEWYEEATERLGGASTAAKVWLTEGGPRLFAEVVQAHINYGSAFAEVASELEKAIGPARAERRSLAEPERENAVALVEALRDSAAEAREQIKGRALALDHFRSIMNRKQDSVSALRDMVERSRGNVSGAIRAVEQEIANLRKILAAAEIKFDEAKIGLASDVKGVLFAVAVKPALTAAGTIGLGAALSVAMLGKTIWQLEKYSKILHENSGKLNYALSNVTAKEYELLLLGGIADTFSTLDQASKRADGVLATLSATWDQTVSDLSVLRSNLALQNLPMDRLPQIQTLGVARATWALIAKAAQDVQNLRFESKTINLQTGA